MGTCGRRAKSQGRRTSRSSRRSPLPWKQLLWVGCLFVGLGAVGFSLPRIPMPQVLARWFCLQRVSLIGTCRLVSPQYLLSVAGLYRGQNLLFLDLQRVRKRLEQIPYLKRVAVERRPGGVLRLYVEERIPIAVVEVFPVEGEETTDPISYLVDREGVPMPWINGHPDFQSLPRIYGVEPSTVQPGKPIKGMEFQTALQLLELWKKKRLPAYPVNLDVSTPDVVQAQLNDGARVRFGVETLPLQQQLERLRVLYLYSAQHHRKLLQIDLSLTNNCPALWRVASGKVQSSQWTN